MKIVYWGSNFGAYHDWVRFWYVMKFEPYCLFLNLSCKRDFHGNKSVYNHSTSNVLAITDGSRWFSQLLPFRMNILTWQIFFNNVVKTRSLLEPAPDCVTITLPMIAPFWVEAFCTSTMSLKLVTYVGILCFQLWIFTKYYQQYQKFMKFMFPMASVKKQSKLKF